MSTAPIDDRLNSDLFTVDDILYSREVRGPAYCRPMFQILRDHECRRQCTTHLNGAAEILLSDPPTEEELARWVRTGFWLATR